MDALLNGSARGIVDLGVIPARGVFIMETNPGARKKLSDAETARMVTALKILSERRGHPVNQITPSELHDLEEEGLIPQAAEDDEP